MGEKDYIRRWIELAKDELKMAEDLMSVEFPVYKGVCLHCQQAVEKIMKGYVLTLGLEIVKTHDISKIGSQIFGQDESCENIIQRVVHFTDYSIRGRYPDDFEDIEDSEARQVLLLSHEVVAFFRIKIQGKLN